MPNLGTVLIFASIRQKKEPSLFLRYERQKGGRRFEDNLDFLDIMRRHAGKLRIIENYI